MEIKYDDNLESRKKEIITAMDNFGNQVSLGVLFIISQKAKNGGIDITEETLKAIIHECAATGLFMVIEQSAKFDVFVEPSDNAFPTFYTNRSKQEKQGIDLN